MKYVFFLVIAFLYVQCQPTTSLEKPESGYKVIEVVDIQKLEVIKEYKRQHRGHYLYYVVKEGEPYVHDGLVTSAKEVIQPRGWAKVGDYISQSTFDSIRLQRSGIQPAGD